MTCGEGARERSLSGAAVLLSVGLVAAAARLFDLGGPSLWLDEAYTYWVARQDVAGVLVAARGDTHPPLFYLLLHFWRLISGDHPASLRLLSVLLGVGSALGTALLGWALGTQSGGLPGDKGRGLRVGLVAGILYAASFAAVDLDVQVRMYSALIFLSVLSTLSLGGATRSGGRLRWAAYATTACAGLYTDVFFSFILGAQVIWVLCFQKGNLKALAAVAAAGATFSLWLPVLQEQALGPAVRALPATTLTSVMGSLAHLTGMGLLLTGPLVAAGVVLILFLVAAWGMRPLPGDSPGAAALPALLLGVPFLVSLVVSLLTPQHIFVERRVGFLTPWLALLVARGLEGLPVSWGRVRSWCRLGIMAMMVAGGLLSLVLYHGSSFYWNQNWPPVAARVAKNARPGDLLLFVPPYAQFSFNFYYKPGTQRFVFVSPGSVNLEQEPSYWKSGGLAQVGLLTPDLRALEAALRGHRRVWLVLSQSEIYDPGGLVTRSVVARGRFLGGMTTRSYWRGGEIRVGLFDLTGASPGPSGPR